MNNVRIRLALAVPAAIWGLLVTSAAAAANVAKLTETCASCHGKDGASTETDMPIIAGVSAEYLSESLKAFQNKERPCPETNYRSGEKKGEKTDMCRNAKALSEADADELAKYYASKKFVRAAQKFDATLAAKGKKLHEDYCDKCHTQNGSFPGDDAGILAGQWMGYLEQAFDEYRSGERVGTRKMQSTVKKLEKEDIEALIQFYGSFK